MVNIASSSSDSLYSNHKLPNSLPKFPEENLLLSRDEGAGYLPARPGYLLKDGRYEVVRKLGYGVTSSTWLVLDQQANPPAYKTLKVLTAYASASNRNGALQELAFLWTTTKLASSPTSSPVSSTTSLSQRSLSTTKSLNVPLLDDSFQHSGPHGVHACFVFPRLYTTLSNVRRTLREKLFPSTIVKVVIDGVLKGLEALHGAGIILTDLKPNNIAFLNPLTTPQIADLLTNAPPSVSGEFTLNGRKYMIMKSQPLPYSIEGSNQAGLSHTVCLTDVGQAQWVSKSHRSDLVAPFALRAPEIILKGGYDTGLDIWSVGCIMYELLTGRWLFNPSGGECWTLEDDHLAKMMELTGDRFTKGFIVDCEMGFEYFDEKCDLTRIPELFSTSLEELIGRCNGKLNLGMDEGEITEMADVMRMCLKLDPKERKTAKEVRKARWLN